VEQCPFCDFVGLESIHLHAVHSAMPLGIGPQSQKEPVVSEASFRSCYYECHQGRPRTLLNSPILKPRSCDWPSKDIVTDRYMKHILLRRSGQGTETARHVRNTSLNTAYPCGFAGFKRARHACWIWIAALVRDNHPGLYEGQMLLISQRAGVLIKKRTGYLMDR